MEDFQCPNRNFFCFVCASYTPSNHSQKITPGFIQAYQKFFQRLFSDISWYIPEIVCENCYKGLMQFKKDEKCYLKYVHPTLWLSRIEHDPDSCYFCVSKKNSTSFQYKFRNKMSYASSEFVVRAKVHDNTFVNESEMEPEFEFDLPSTSYMQTETTSEYVQPTSTPKKLPHLITQTDFDDLVRDMALSSTKAEILGSRLKQWNLVASDYKITAKRNREHAADFDECFSYHEERKIAYCNDIDKLFETISHPYNPEDWRLFIDSSVQSLKGVLLHIGNKYPSIPIIYAAKEDSKEDYETMKLVLELVNYELHEWRICCYLKVVSILTGVKGGFSKHQCFLCNWEGRQTDKHYTDYQWKRRETYEVGKDSIVNEPLVRAEKIIIPPLHIKLGLIRNFVRAMDKNSAAFAHLKSEFPRLSAAKIDAGEFIRKLICIL